MRLACEQGSLVQVSLPGTSLHGRLGTVESVTRKTAKWPVLYIISLDRWGPPDPDAVEELHLKVEEFHSL